MIHETHETTRNSYPLKSTFEAKLRCSVSYYLAKRTSQSQDSNPKKVSYTMNIALLYGVQNVSSASENYKHLTPPE